MAGLVGRPRFYPVPATTRAVRRIGLRPHVPLISRFYVAMDDVPVVGVTQRSGNLSRELVGIVDGKLLVTPQPLAQALALYLRHDVEMEPAVGFVKNYPQDVV